MLAVTKFIRGPPTLFQTFVRPVCGIDTLNPLDCTWSQLGDFGNSYISSPEGPFTAILTNLNSRVVQEEVGVRGAMTAAEVIKSDVGFAIEVGIATDNPGTNTNQLQEKLGARPGILTGPISTTL